MWCIAVALLNISLHAQSQCNRACVPCISSPDCAGMEDRLQQQQIKPSWSARGLVQPLCVVLSGSELQCDFDYQFQCQHTDLHAAHPVLQMRQSACRSDHARHPCFCGQRNGPMPLSWPSTRSCWKHSDSRGAAAPALYSTMCGQHTCSHLVCVSIGGLSRLCTAQL